MKGADLELMNETWDHAKASEFDVDLLKDEADKIVIAAATEAALDEGCRLIQEHLGSETGDFAGLFFSGNGGGDIAATFRRYLEAERSQATD